MESDAGSQIRHWHTYLHDMIGNFKSGCSGFIDWNLLLNSEGGRIIRVICVKRPFNTMRKTTCCGVTTLVWYWPLLPLCASGGEGHAFFKLR